MVKEFLGAYTVGHLRRLGVCIRGGVESFTGFVIERLVSRLVCRLLPCSLCMHSKGLGTQNELS